MEAAVRLAVGIALVGWACFALYASWVWPNVCENAGCDGAGRLIWVAGLAAIPAVLTVAQARGSRKRFFAWLLVALALYGIWAALVAAIP